MSEIDHRAEAEAVLAYIPDATDKTAELAFASEATAHALLAVEARLAEIAQEQRTASLIAAHDAGILSRHDHNDWEEIDTAIRQRLEWAGEDEKR